VRNWTIIASYASLEAMTIGKTIAIRAIVPMAVPPPLGNRQRPGRKPDRRSSRKLSLDFPSLLIASPLGARCLLDVILLIEVVARAKELDIHGQERGATFRPWENVVEMEVVFGTAFCALALVAFPDGLLD